MRLKENNYIFFSLRLFIASPRNPVIPLSFPRIFMTVVNFPTDISAID